jgi:hypothetical protein
VVVVAFGFTVVVVDDSGIVVVPGSDVADSPGFCERSTTS